MKGIRSFFAHTGSLDLTEGDPIRLLIRFSIPIFLSTLLQTLYGTVDTIVIGRYLGGDAIAATGLTQPLVFMVLGGIIGLCSGTSFITSQLVGAHDENGVRKSIAASALISLGGALVVSAIVIPLIPAMLRLLKCPDMLLSGSSIYLYWIFGGILATTLFNFAFSEIRALGDSTTPLIFLAIVAVLNVFFNILFVGSFHWGYHGIGAATLLVTLLAAIGCLSYAVIRFPEFRLRKSDWQLSWRFIWKHLYNAVPTALQFSVTAIGIIVLQSAINTLGPKAISVISAGCRFEWLAAIPHTAIGITLATYTAQNIGAGKLDRIHLGVKACLKAMIAWTLFAAIFMILFSNQIADLFFGTYAEPEHYRLLRTYFFCTCPFYVFLGTIHIFRNTIQGMGLPTIPFIGGIGELLARAGLSYWFLGMWGYVGVSIAGPMAWVFTGTLLFLYYELKIKRSSLEELHRI